MSEEHLQLLRQLEEQSDLIKSQKDMIDVLNDTITNMKSSIEDLNSQLSNQGKRIDQMNERHISTRSLSSLSTSVPNLKRLPMNTRKSISSSKKPKATKSRAPKHCEIDLTSIKDDDISTIESDEMVVDDLRTNADSNPSNLNASPSSTVQASTSSDRAPFNSNKTQNNSNQAQSSLNNKISAGYDDWQQVIYKNTVKFETPIVVETGNDKDSVSTLIATRNIDNSLFSIKRFNISRPLQIFAIGSETKTKIMDVLSAKKYEFHTNDKDQPKSKCFILRGMLTVVTTDSIKKRLLEAGLPDSIEVTRYITGHMRANPGKESNILYKITMPEKCDANILKKFTGFSGSHLRFEPIKKSGIVQCKNCQRFTHSTRMCHYNYRCVKCNADHNPGECPRNRNANIPVSCVNCQGNHNANNLLECPTAKKLQSMQNNVSNNLSNNFITAKSNFNNIPANRNIRDIHFPVSNTESNFVNRQYSNVVANNSQTYSNTARNPSSAAHINNLNIDNLRDVVHSIVTECISKLCFR